MKNKCHIRFITLRRALILPFFIAVFSLLCFTTGISQVKYKAKNASKTALKASLHLNDSLAIGLDSANLASVDSTFIADSIKMNLPNNNVLSLGFGNLNKQQIDKALNDCSTQTALALKELDKIIHNNLMSIKNEEISLIFKNLDVNGGGKNLGQLPFSDKFLASITKDDLKSFQANLSNLKVNVDKLKKESSNQAKIDGLSQQVMLLFQNQLFSKIFSEAMQMSMPKFDSKPQSRKLISTRFDGNTTTNVYDDGSTSTTTKIITTPELSQAEKERQVLNEKIWKEAYRARPEQIRVSDIPFDSRETKVARIEKNKNDTKVTLAIPIVYNEHWVYFDRAFAIVDKKSQDRYVIRRLENDLPLDKTIIISNNNQKMIEITMVFPPLQKSVEFVDIIEYHSDDAVKMSNGNGNWKFMNIPIAQYSGKIYK